MNPIFSDIKDSLSIFNIENYSESYKNACELLIRKFEELRNLLSSLDIEKTFFDYLKENPKEMEKFEMKFRQMFTKLTRLQFGEVLPKECAICKTNIDLQIHHIRYVYPIKKKDLVRLCRQHHTEEHQKITPTQF